MKDFDITSICKEDLKEHFSDKQINSLDDSDMRRIASKMADAYLENGFWQDLQIITEYVLKDK